MDSMVVQHSPTNDSPSSYKPSGSDPAVPSFALALPAGLLPTHKPTQKLIV